MTILSMKFMHICCSGILAFSMLLVEPIAPYPKGAVLAGLAPADESHETVVTINIRSREFHPHMVFLTMGQIGRAHV